MKDAVTCMWYLLIHQFTIDCDCHKNVKLQKDTEEDHSSECVSAFPLSFKQYVDMSKPHSVSIQTRVWTAGALILYVMAATTPRKTTWDFE